mmetsp:Transcript_987/g.2805  ORF Transcript_987/g.2805 Transcript_987/m.2805 type:complete len:211 (+) Transcript_987:253-885(+)
MSISARTSFSCRPCRSSPAPHSLQSLLRPPLHSCLTSMSCSGLRLKSSPLLLRSKLSAASSACLRSPRMPRRRRHRPPWSSSCPNSQCWRRRQRRPARMPLWRHSSKRPNQALARRPRHLRPPCRARPSPPLLESGLPRPLRARVRRPRRLRLPRRLRPLPLLLQRGLLQRLQASRRRRHRRRSKVMCLLRHPRRSTRSREQLWCRFRRH